MLDMSYLVHEYVSSVEDISLGFGLFVLLATFFWNVGAVARRREFIWYALKTGAIAYQMPFATVLVCAAFYHEETRSSLQSARYQLAIVGAAFLLYAGVEIYESFFEVPDRFKSSVR